MLYSTVGDAAHVATLLNAVAFLVVVGLYAGDKASSFLFDEAWKNDGFCVAGKAKSYWSSHDVCLYMDLALATGLAVLFLFLRHTAGLEAANKFIVPGWCCWNRSPRNRPRSHCPGYERRRRH